MTSISQKETEGKSWDTLGTIDFGINSANGIQALRKRPSLRCTVDANNALMSHDRHGDLNGT